MRIAIVSDAAPPQVNGVVRTLNCTTTELEKLGHAVRLIGPAEFATVPAPSYPEIRLALAPGWRLAKLIETFAPDAIHIATEGPLGYAARKFCLRRGYPFTTAYHTRFPEYLEPRFRVPAAWTYSVLRRFHAPARRIMVATHSMEQELAARGFTNLVRWSRGVDVDLFRPGPKDSYPWPRPILLYVGRVAVEKNIEAFLNLDVPGTKVVIGDGPQRRSLEARYPQARFLGKKSNGDLARHYAAADVFVFPSRTDTFGLVLLEAMAAGVPVAAYPVPGPLDVIGESGAGAMSDDLGAAVELALQIDGAACRTRALGFSWEASARQFAAHVAPVVEAAVA